MRNLTALLLLIAAVFGGAAAGEGAAVVDPYEPAPYVRLTHPEWSRNASIYQVNIRQFTEEGTLAAAERQLPRIRDLGARIVWLMPIHEIGRKNRKGSLGSPYSVRDYYSVNPEFGTLEDLKRFVARAHELGLYVILDWVANHTAWDNPLVAEHPDWYERDWKGDFRPTPWWDWEDIIDLDFSKRDVREYMTNALRYWVIEADIDGFRCDVAGYVPVDFWNNVRRELDRIKPVFMLAEWESRDLHAEAFDMTYAWAWYEAVHDIAQGRADVNALFGYYSANESAYPADAFRMNFVSNHDKNAWEATQFEAFGDALDAAIVLSVVGEGMPLIYSGQEAGNPRRLAFFEKDPIEWRPHPIGDLYAKLFALKAENSALWNGAWGARMHRVPNDAPARVFSFVRRNDVDKVFAVFNFSDEPAETGFDEALYHGRYTEFFSGDEMTLGEGFRLALAPWSYRIFVADQPAR